MADHAAAAYQNAQDTGTEMATDRYHDTRLFRRVHIGFTDQGQVLTAPKTHLLTLGPTQGVVAGKTSNVLAPAILAGEYGPLICISTREDLLEATAVYRRRIGPVFVYDPTGAELPLGCERFTFSPLYGCEDWSFAVQVAQSWVEAMQSQGGETVSMTGDQAHWTFTAQDALACLFHYHAIRGKTMEQMVLSVREGAYTWYLAVRDFLKEHGSPFAYTGIAGLLNTPDRERGSHFSTLRRLVSILADPVVLESTKDPVNVDGFHYPMAKPDETTIPALGVLPFPYVQAGLANSMVDKAPGFTYASLYIVLDETAQRRLGPLVICLMNALRRARHQFYRRYRKDRTAEEDVSATFVVLDELHSLNMPTLYDWLTNGAAEGWQCLMAAQDLQQLNKWGAERASGFLALTDRLILPGVTDTETLESLSKLTGVYDRPQYSHDEFTYQEHVRVAPHEIFEGHRQNPDIAFYMRKPHPNEPSWAWVYTTPYYRAVPFPKLLIDSMLAMNAWRIPIVYPELDRDGSGRFLGPLAPTYHRLVAEQEEGFDE